MSDYFNMGNALGSAYSEGKEETRQRNRQIETDTRAKKVFDDQQAEGLYQRTQRGQEDAAFANYTAAQNGGAAPGAGLSPESGALVQKGYAGDTGVRALQTEGGDAAREGARMGIPQAPAAQRAPATPRQLNAMLAPIYAQQKNAKGMSEVAAQDKVLHIGEIKASSGVAWQNMEPTERAKWAGGVSSDYKGDIAITSQTPEGYYLVTLGKVGAPGTKTIALDDAEAQQMYAASRLMAEGHGEEAQKMMLAGGEKLRAIATEHNKFVADSAKINNEAAHNKASDKSAAISADAHRVASGAAVVTAGAAVRRAAADEAHVGLYVKEADRANAALDNVKKLEAAFADLSPADQAGDTGRGLRHQIQIANLKPGGQIAVADPRGGAQQIKYEVTSRWADAEKKLMGDGVKPADIQVQKDGFYAREGFAPPAALAELASGRHKADGSKLTDDDVADFQRLFPNTPIDQSKLKWLKPAAPPAKGVEGIPVPGYVRGPSTAGVIPPRRPSEPKTAPYVRGPQGQ